MPVFSSIYYYAGILNYTSGVVVWDLNWAETSPGIPPYIDNTGLPPEQVGIVFTSPELGAGARGTATITATVDGIPALAPITALVPAPLCSYFDYEFSQVFPETTSLNWTDHPEYRFRVYVDSLLNVPILLTFDPTIVTTLEQLVDSIIAQLPPDFSCFLIDQEGDFGTKTHLIIQRTAGTFAIIDNDGTVYPNIGYNYGVLDYSALYAETDNDSVPLSPFEEELSLTECLVPPPPPPYISEWWGQSSESGLYTDYSGFHGWDVLPWYLYRVMVRRNSFGSVLEFIPDTDATVPTSTWNPVNIDTTGPSLILDDAVQGRWILDPEPAWFQGGGTFTIFGNNTQELIYDLAQPSDSSYLNASWYQYIPPEVGPPSIELVLPVENYFVDENGPNITDNIAWYKFTVDGDYTLSAGTLNSDPLLDTLIGLYDQTGELITYNDDFQDYLSFIEANVIAGQYFIAIGMYPSQFNQSNFSASGTYAIEPGLILDVTLQAPLPPPPPPPPGAMVMSYELPFSGYDVTLPLRGATNVTVSWGDGLVQTFTTPGDYTRVYQDAGVYQVWISGSLEGFGNDSVSQFYLKEVSDWGTLGLTSLSAALYETDGAIIPNTLPPAITDLSWLFKYATNISTSIADWDTSTVTNMSSMFHNTSPVPAEIQNWDTSSVTDMSYMFYGSNINMLLPWNTSSVTNMSHMFEGTTLFNSDISGWVTSSVTDMSYMFAGARVFNQPIGLWNTTNVTNMSHMFEGSAGYTAFNQPLNSWDTSSVTDMSYMFRLARFFNQDLDLWDTSNVTNMSNMFASQFYYGHDFNGNIGTWDTSLVTDMSSMFEVGFNGNHAFSGDISSWNTTNVTNMSSMFVKCINFNSNISGWSTSNVTNMSNMFNQALAFNQPIGIWDTSGVTNMSYMFSGYNIPGNMAFSQDISSWDTSNVTNMSYMFFYAGNFSSNIGSWDTSSVTDMRYMFDHAFSFNQDIGAWITGNVSDMAGMFYFATTFNQDLSGWCVSLIGTKPFNFDNNTLAWVKPGRQPVWGTCP